MITPLAMPTAVDAIATVAPAATVAPSATGGPPATGSFASSLATALSVIDAPARDAASSVTPPDADAAVPAPDVEIDDLDTDVDVAGAGDDPSTDGAPSGPDDDGAVDHAMEEPQTPGARPELLIGAGIAATLAAGTAGQQPTPAPPTLQVPATDVGAPAATPARAVARQDVTTRALPTASDDVAADATALPGIDRPVASGANVGQPSSEPTLDTRPGPAAPPARFDDQTATPRSDRQTSPLAAAPAGNAEGPGEQTVSPEPDRATAPAAPTVGAIEQRGDQLVGPRSARRTPSTAATDTGGSGAQAALPGADRHSSTVRARAGRVVDGAETAGPVAAPSRSDDGVQPVLTVAPSAAPTAPAPSSTPVVAAGAATMTRSDAVRYLRELGPARAVQRLAVDLDGTTVAVRIDSAGTSPVVHVQVLDDPSGRLGATWTTGVERALTHVVGNQEARFGGQPTHDQRRHPPRPLPDDTPTTNAARRWALAVADGGTHHD